MTLVALVEIQAPMEVEGLPRVVATRVLWSQLYRHRLPAHLLPFRCVCIVQHAAIPSFAWLQQFELAGFHHFTGPISTVFDPSVGPVYLPCSNRETRGPRQQLDGCKGIHHTHRTVPRVNGTPSHTSFVCCLAVSTSRNTTVHAGGIRHKTSHQIAVCWQLNIRSSLHLQLDRSDMPFDDTY